MVGTSHAVGWRAQRAALFVLLLLHEIYRPCIAWAAGANANDDSEALIVGLLVLLFLAALLFSLPTFIAFFRVHPNRWIILLINIFFGGTGIGWLGALIWALHKVHDPVSIGSHGGESGLNLFANDVKRIQLEASVPRARAEDYLGDLERLATLYSAGHLSEAEYSSEKKKILERSVPLGP